MRSESRNTCRPVVVCGAGAAGLSAALSAARRGAQVCLIEASSRLGGTATHALIHTLAGLYDTRGELINDGLPRELVEKLTATDERVRQRQMGRTFVLSVCPSTYERVVEDWISRERRITVLRSTRVVGVETARGLVKELEAIGPNGSIGFRPRGVIDATGTAEIVRLIEPALVHDDPQRAAGGLIFTLRGVEPGALAFPRGLAVVRELRQAASQGDLPSECGQAWLDGGVRDDEVYVKMFVPLQNGWRARESRGEVSAEARRWQSAVVEFLQRRPQFAGARVERTGTLGVRDGGRVRGEYCLTESDVKACRKFPDAACRCAWPIEYWDPRDGVGLDYLPDGGDYEIPLRSLTVQGMKNVWAAGKCLSADRRAQASARCIGTCWAMGEAVGKAAADCRTS